MHQIEEGLVQQMGKDSVLPNAIVDLDGLSTKKLRIDRSMAYLV